jgi:hypothetical protein
MNSNKLTGCHDDDAAGSHRHMSFSGVVTLADARDLRWIDVNPLLTIRPGQLNQGDGHDK